MSTRRNERGFAKVRAGAVTFGAFVLGFGLTMSTPAAADATTHLSGRHAELETTFYNPIIDSGADPWVIRAGHEYYLTMTTGTNVTVWKSKNLTGIGNGKSQVVWQSDGTDYADIWAPELHQFGNHWYIYFAADKNGANATHRMYVLKSKTSDPMGPYLFVGQIHDPSNQWAIDGTILSYRHKLYFIWSGWTSEADEVTQNLYIAPMNSPTNIDGKRVLLSTPTYSWETSVAPINEGPEILQHEGKTFLIYSANASWTNSYCLGMLTLIGNDPLNPSDWKKSPHPVFASAGDVYGPGHASFTVSPNGKQDFIVYHAARYSLSGWNRNIRTQPFHWHEDGTPNFGKPLQTNVPLPLPAGETPFTRKYLPTEEHKGTRTFHFQVTKEGNHPLWIRYSNGTGLDTTLNLSVNHSLGLTLTFPNTDGWNLYSSAELTLHLKAGENTLQFTGNEYQARVPFIEVGHAPQ